MQSWVIVFLNITTGVVEVEVEPDSAEQNWEVSLSTWTVEIAAR
jgi:hypothetical protein